MLIHSLNTLRYADRVKELVVDGADLSHEHEPNLVKSDPSVSDLNLQLITVSCLESAFALSEN